VSLDIHLNRTLRNGLRTTITLMQLVETGRDSYQKTLFSYDMDTCKTLRELLQASLMKVWLRNVFKYGNLADRCPIQPVRSSPTLISSKRVWVTVSYPPPLQADYEVRNFQLENNSIPAYLPPGSYRLHDTNYYGRPKGKQRRLVATFVLDIKFY
ncbi:hypothetical protein KR038_008487, partial [Drosophila bunnanda]